MSNCRKFIHGINAINFSAATAKSFRIPLIQYAYEELRAEEERLSKLLANLPEDIADNDIAKKQLADYKKKQQGRIDGITNQLKLIVKENPTINFSQKIDPLNLEKLITDFATNFRDIKHLAYTLSDAPPFIKGLRIRLYLHVLMELTKPEQETQFQSLTLMTIKDTTLEAMALYEQSPKNPELRNQCQKLVQMAFYELVRRTCQQCAAAAEADKYHQYIKLLKSLNDSILPAVGRSAIIDNLSAHRASDSRSIIDLLAETERALKIDLAADWEKDEKISAVIERKKLLHTLRFGQEDRREYAKKIQMNLARDLFWARGIHDADLFTKSTIASDAYLGINLRNYVKAKKEILNTSSPLKDEDLREFDTPAERRLASVIKKIANECSQKGVFKGSTQVLNSPDKRRDNAIKNTNDIATEVFKEFFEKAHITVKGKLITVELFHIDSASVLTKKMLDAGGFGLFPSTMLKSLKKQDELEGLHGISLTGASLVDISKQFNAQKNIPEEARRAYELQLTLLEKSIPKVTLKDKIKKLQLENDKEVLLGKLLELYDSSYLTKNPTLKNAYVLLDEEKITEALHLAGLEGAIKEAYELLAKKDEKNLAAPLKALVTKSQQISLSIKKRNEGAVDKLFEANKDEDTTAKELSDIFKAEYRAMAPMLRLSDKEGMVAEDKLSAIDAKIDDMARELVRFMNRTKEAKPALTQREEEIYFNVIQAIAEAIHPTLIKDVQFKIKHSHDVNTKTISIKYPDGTVEKVKIELDDDDKLPYSLIKPPGSDFIFSYGGTRGILAPVKGVDAAYSGAGGEKAPFSNSKLVGLGQYGTVKEIEHLLTGLNKVVKKGNVPANDKGSAFTPVSVSNPLTRPLTSRDDPLFRTESDVLKWLSAAQDTDSSGTVYWIDKDKARPAGALFADADRSQYHLLTDKAKGETYADTANKLRDCPNSEMAYHDPSKRNEANPLGSLKEMLNLSQAIVAESQKFEALGFAHNDIKPENFLYKKNSDGSYQVSFIDWATGGFEKKYIGKAETAEQIFEDVFGSDLPKKANAAKDEYTDDSGRFVRVTANSKVFGINPTLQILHGARNGTLPYISPKVLGDKIPKAANVVDPTQNTILIAHQRTMDDWALTAMTFGICNRHSYFTLVKGRIVNDYVIPGILQADDKTPQGLEIVNVAKFNEFFACGDAHKINKKEDATSQKNAVMYIPANQREGEPLYLYRRLTKLLETLKGDKQRYADANSAERGIATRVERVLSLAMQAVASGEGFNKGELQRQLAEAQDCLKSYELLNDPDFLKSQSNGKVLQAIFDQDRVKAFTEMTLLVKSNAVSPLEALCTYPSTNKQKEDAVRILDRAFSREDLFNDTFLTGKKPPARYLFQECIKQKQEEILILLLSKIQSKANISFIEMIRDDGLLHYAAEQGLTKVFSALISALIQTGYKHGAILGLMLTEHGPGEGQIKTSAPVKWSGNCFHIAIRNNNPEQLALILNLWPKDVFLDEVIKKALHLCAVLGNKILYKQIVDKFNNLHSETAEQIDPEKVLKMTFSPDDSSPYHLFLNDVSPEDPKKDVIPWDVLEENKNKALSTQFLLTPPKGTLAYPLLIAAKSGNITGVRRIISLAETIELSGLQWAALYRQTDAAGKNVFNYLLEQKQLLDLDVLITNINGNCTDPASVLADLLSTPQPVNALTNYLNAEQNQEVQFQVVNQLFDAISPDFNEEKLQHIRLVTLLVNRPWLIDKANQETSHERLSTLLFDNDKLSMDFKRILFTELVKVAPPNSIARGWFSARLADITAKQPPVNQAEALGMPADVAFERARQENDINGLFAALNNQGVNAQAIKELQELAALSASNELRLKTLADATQQKVEALTAQLAARDALVQQNGLEQVELKNNITALTTALDGLRLSTTGEINRLKAAAVEKDAAHQRAIDKQSSESYETVELTINNYEGEKTTFIEALKSASDKATQLESRIVALTSDLRQKIGDNSALTSELEQLRKSKDEQIATFNLTAAQNNEAHAAALANQIAQAKQELDKAIAAFNRDRERLQNTLEAQKSNDHSALQSTIASLSKELLELGSIKDNEIKGLNVKITGFQALMQEHSKLSEQMAIDLGANKAEKTALKVELAKLQKQMDDQIVQIEAHHAALNANAASDASEILEEIRDEKSRLELSLKAAEAAGGVSQSQVQALTSELKALEQSSRKTLEASQAAQDAVYSQLQSEFNAFKEASQQLLATSDSEKNNQLRALQTQNDALSLQLTTINQQKTALESALASATASGSASQSELEALHGQISTFKQQLEALSITHQKTLAAEHEKDKALILLQQNNETLTLQLRALKTDFQGVVASDADEASPEADETDLDEADPDEADPDADEAGVDEAEILTSSTATQKTGASKPAQGNPILENEKSWTTIKNTNSAKLKVIMDGVAPLGEMKQALDSLSSTSMIWLNPAFQDSAKYYALGLTQNFHELAQNTGLLIPYLKKQIDKLNELLSAIPDDKELRVKARAYQSEVIEYRALLKRSLQDLENYLATQISLRKQLRGNKDKETLIEKQGLLKTVEQAINEKKDLRQVPGLYTITYVDYPLADKATYLAGLPKNAKVSSMEVSLPKDPYQTVNRVETGCFRVHKLSVNDRPLGEFIEERPMIGVEHDNAKTKLKLSIVSFPEAVEDKIIYSMSIVTQLLVSLKAAPTASKPIVLKGDNLEELHYLWTSLMVISAQSGLRFDRQSIKVNNTTFNFKNEFDESTGQYKPDSYYRKYFENSTQLTTLVNHTKHLMTDKLGYQNEHKRVQEYSVSALSLFREKMSGTLRTIEEEQDEPVARQKK